MISPNRVAKFGISLPFLVSSLALSGLQAREVTRFVSAMSGERMARQPAAAFLRVADGEHSIFVIAENNIRQTITGFGASFSKPA